MVDGLCKKMTAAPSSLAVVHRRVEPADSLDYFPTPPWAGRALVEHVIGRRGLAGMSVEEPACGEGHLAHALADSFGTVRCSDVKNHGFRLELPFCERDFLDPADWLDVPSPDWIVTNPPFGDRTLAFMMQAIRRRPRVGIAFFLRTTALDGLARCRNVYARTPPAIVAQFAERVPCHRGRWVVNGSTATAYLWMVWRFDRPVAGTRLIWIPRCRERLCYQRDIDRFGVIEEAESLQDEGDLA